MVNNGITTTGSFNLGTQKTASAASYELLLHALSHEQTKTNYDRHVLVLEKWCRESTGGLYISDLTYVVSVLQILKERIAMHPTMFEPVLASVLKNCSKPLLESKANERMRPSGFDNIKAFYAELSKFWESGNVFARIECSRCFNCIVNGGRDTSVLKADQAEWKSDGFTAQVTDITFVFSLIRESGALGATITEFHRTVEDLTAEKLKFLRVSSSLTKMQAKKNVNQTDDSDDEEEDKGDEGSEATADVSIPPTQSKLGGVTRSMSTAYAEIDLSDEVERRRAHLVSIQEMVSVLLDICLTLSADHKNASSMCTMRICDTIIKLLRDAAAESVREPTVTVCVQILWDCLEAFFKEFSPNSGDALVAPSDEIMDFETAVQTLKVLFHDLLLQGYRLADKEVRNEVLVVLTLVGRFTQAVPFFIKSGLLNILVTYACVGEAGKEAWPYFALPLAKSRNFASGFDIDVQLKRELWMLLSDIMKLDDPDILLCIASSPLLTVLVRYLEQNTLNAGGTSASSVTRAGLPNELHDQAADLNGDASQPGSTASRAEVSAPAQLRELQILAMVFLAENAHRLMGEFVRIDGPVKILEVMSRYGDAVSVEYRSLLFHSLLLLNRCLTCSNMVKAKLEAHEAIRVFLQQFQISSDDAIKAQAARLISIMCTDSEVSQTQFRKLSGIGSLVSSLALYAEHRRPLVGCKAKVPFDSADNAGMEDPTTTQAGDEVSLLIVAVLDCLRNSVVGNKKNEARFSHEEGVDALLEVVEVAPMLIRIQSLRLLGDILANSRLVPFALAWRSMKSMRSAGQLLAHAWMDEEARLDTRRDVGVLSNLWDPLGAHRWPLDPKIHAQSGIDGSVTSGGSVSSATIGTGGPSPGSSTVNKLVNAVVTNRSGSAGVLGQVRSDLLSLDHRGIIANVLSLLSLLDNSAADVRHMKASTENLTVMEGGLPSEKPADEGVMKDSGLTPLELQVMSMAARYGILREGQWWCRVMDELLAEGVEPIEADAVLIMERVEKLFQAARAVQFEQMELVACSQRMKQASEGVFMGRILQQKNQEIKAEYYKKKALYSKGSVSTKVKLSSTS